jgi:magnesium transporter
MIEIYKNTLKSPILRKVGKIESGCWIRAIAPDPEEIECIVDKLKIDPAILEDGLDENEIARVEKEDDIFYMIIRLPMSKEGYISTIPLLVIITEKHIATICREEETVTRYFLEKERELLTTQKTAFVLKILSEIFRTYDVYVNRLLKDIKQKKFEINRLSNRDILFLVQVEETLNDFISSLTPVIAITERISRGKFLTIYEKDIDVMEDLVWDGKQTLEISGTGLKSIKNIREAYSSILTNDLNKVMKVLTIATIMLTVPTIVASVFGMNVPLPLQNNPMAFLYVMGIICLLSVVLFVIIVKRRWI